VKEKFPEFRVPEVVFQRMGWPTHGALYLSGGSFRSALVVKHLEVSREERGNAGK